MERKQSFDLLDCEQQLRTVRDLHQWQSSMLFRLPNIEMEDSLPHVKALLLEGEIGDEQDFDRDFLASLYGDVAAYTPHLNHASFLQAISTLEFGVVCHCKTMLEQISKSGVWAENTSKSTWEKVKSVFKLFNETADLPVSPAWRSIIRYSKLRNMLTHSSGLVPIKHKNLNEVEQLSWVQTTPHAIFSDYLRVEIDFHGVSRAIDNFIEFIEILHTKTIRGVTCF